MTVERTIAQEVVRTVMQLALGFPDYLPYAILPIVALIGAFAPLVRRERQVETMEMKKKPKEMEIKVLHNETNKLARLEVRPDNSIGSVVEDVVSALKLSKDETYVLLHDGEGFDQSRYSIVLSKAGIEGGDQLEIKGIKKTL